MNCSVEKHLLLLKELIVDWLVVWLIIEGKLVSLVIKLIVIRLLVITICILVVFLLHLAFILQSFYSFETKLIADLTPTCLLVCKRVLSFRVHATCIKRSVICQVLCHNVWIPFSVFWRSSRLIRMLVILVSYSLLRPLLTTAWISLVCSLASSTIVHLRLLLLLMICCSWHLAWFAVLWFH